VRGIDEEKEKGRFLYKRRGWRREKRNSQAYTCMAHCLTHNS
jgi:hypothetical protein